MFCTRYFADRLFAPRYFAKVGATPVPAHTIYRLDQSAAGGDVFRGSTGGSGDIYRTPPATGGKVYR